MVSDSRKLRLLLKDCAKGFYQQMYFWGKDVTHSTGNQLQAYGFKKSPSKGLRGTSCYTYQDHDTTIELYGSCAGYYTDAANMVFLRRKCRFYEWLPEERVIAGRWSQDDIQLHNPEKMLSSLIPFLKWWVSYEKWILQRLGKEYREQCHAEWTKVNKKRSWLPPTSALQWVEDFIKNQEAQLRPKCYIA